jgi:MFS family permease
MQLGLISAVRGLPMLVFGVVAGVAADRYNRKTQLIVAQILNSLLNLLLAVLIVTHRVELWQLYVTGFLAGTVQAFQQPCRQAMMGDIVPTDRLPNAIPLNSAAINVSRFIGPALGGLLIAMAPLSAALPGAAISYFVESAFYLSAMIWTVRIHIPEAVQALMRSAKAAEAKFSDSAREGFKYVAAHRVILALVLLGLVPALLAQPYMSLMPVFAEDVFKGGAKLQGQLTAMAGIGGVIGAFGIASMGALQGKGKTLVAGACIFGLALISFGLSPVVAMAMFFVLIAGLAQSAYNAQNQTLIQLLVPHEYRGRVLGIYLLDRALMPVGSLMAGALAEYLGGPFAVAIMGFTAVAVAAGVAFAVPELWRVNALRQRGQPGVLGAHGQH